MTDSKWAMKWVNPKSIFGTSFCFNSLKSTIRRTTSWKWIWLFCPVRLFNMSSRWSNYIIMDVFSSFCPPNIWNDCYSCLIICLVSVWQMLGALTAIPIKVPHISSLQRLAGHSPVCYPQVIHNISKTLKPVFMKPYYLQIIFIAGTFKTCQRHSKRQV